MPLSYEYLNGVDSKFLRNMHFSKEHKRDLKKLQANNTKAVSVHVEATKALQKPKEVKPKISKGSSYKLNRLPYIAYPKFGKCACPYKAKGLRLCHPKSKAKAAATAQVQGPAQA